MADILVGVLPQGATPARRFKDMGDGTFAEVVFAATGTSPTDVTSSATAAPNTATSATLAAAAGKTTYLTGFAVTVATGTAGPTGLITITGTIGGTLNFQLGGNASGAVIHVDFARPVPASAVNTAIVVNVPALGATTGAVAVTARGYQQ